MVSLDLFLLIIRVKYSQSCCTNEVLQYEAVCKGNTIIMFIQVDDAVILVYTGVDMSQKRLIPPILIVYCGSKLHSNF